MSDPRRLRESGDDPVVASLLDAARAYQRPVASRNRILKVLGLPAALSVGLPTAALASSLGTKMILVISTATVLVAGGGAVAYRAHVRAQEHERARTAIHHGATPRALRPPETAARPVREPVAPALAEPATPEAPPAPVTAALPAHPSSVAPAPTRRRQPARQPRSLVESIAREEPPIFPATTREPEGLSPPKPIAPPAVSFSGGESLAYSVSSRPPLPSAAPPAALPRRAPLAREIALLDAAERAERQQDHRSALARLDQYAREFPDGALLAEAEVLRISTLFGAGEAATAQRRARSFLAASAPSPLTARVASMLSRASRESEKKELP